MNHRDPEFLAIFTEARQSLLEIYEGMADWQACLIGGGGTAAVEAMIGCCTGDRKCLVLVNGYYSQRKADMLATLGKQADTYSLNWLDGFTLVEVERMVGTGEFDTVLVVHNETTTGRLNDINGIGAIAKKHGALFLVDAMSSFGAERIDSRVVDAIASSANKCLHGVPGVSFVLVSPDAIRRIESNLAPTYYLNLKYMLGREPNSTPPVPAIIALNEALQEFPGWRGRHEEYRGRASFVRSELGRRGFRPVIPLEQSSVALTTYFAPEPFSTEGWIAANRSQGFLLYGCKGDLKDSAFQVANMGELTMNQLQSWIELVDRLLGRS
jgi:2-aminoethylphosphonate-pyruvate transaminase